MKTTTATQTDLMNKIKTKQIKAGIIGLGYVGLPLAVEFARSGIQVAGIDIDVRKVDAVNRADSYIQDVSAEHLEELVRLEKRLCATNDFSVIKDLDTVNICVPTPLRKSKDPDISYIVSAAQEVAKYLHEGMLIILESTTYPGTTEEVILPMLEETGLKAGKDFYLAFSPERVDPGNPSYHTRNIPKVVGGYSAQCTELAQAFYSLAIDKVHAVSSTRAAEMVKLLENTFRSVNIGLVNELCQMSQKLDLNIWEIIDAAASKPFGFMPFYPGPGLGGHCIPIDPHYLAWKARINGFNPRFIDLASDVNAQMPEFVVRKAQHLLNQAGHALKNSEILILGVTYKKNVSDLRESPALEIIELFLKQGAQISYLDPFVSRMTLHDQSFESIDLEDYAKVPNLVVLLTDHDKFDYAKMHERFPLILDTRNAFREFKSEKIVRL